MPSPERPLAAVPTQPRASRRRAWCSLAVGAFALALASSAAAQPSGSPPPGGAPPGTPPGPAAPAGGQPVAPPAGAQPAPAPPAAPAQPGAAAPKAAAPEPLIPAGAAPGPVTTPMPVPRPDPAKDKGALVKQSDERPVYAGDVPGKPSEVYAEDWWSAARPTFEIHGYYRVRAELFHHFDLGRIDGATALWPTPADNDYFDIANKHHMVQLCGPDPTTTNLQACKDNTQAGANMRFRINPELHISDNLRILSQIDMLDNVVLGSTPEGYANLPSGGSTGGYVVQQRGGTTPFGGFSSTVWAPTAGVNSTENSITVKRVWGEFMTPVGLLRFGRMPSHWGLGMVANSGDGYDSDWQTTVDRIMFVTGIKKWDLYFAGAWDFPNEGATSASYSQLQGQPYDLSQLDDVNQYVLLVVRKRNIELQKLDLAKGNFVLNGGLLFVYRNQFLANDAANGGGVDQALGQTGDQVQKGYVRRGLSMSITDAWVQVLYKKFRFEAEGALIWGSLDSIGFIGTPGDYTNPTDPNNNGWKIRQFGLATQSEFRAVEDKLRIQFGFGYATGDPDTSSLTAGVGGFQPQLTADRTFSEFRFHPDYRIDLILFRNILQEIQGAYYFRPSVDYDFFREKNGQKLGGGAAIIWSRASEFIQTPGHARDLGVELNFQVYFQSRDGTLNDDPDKMGGFYTSIQYGVLFPLGGLGYLPNQVTRYNASTGAQTGTTLDTATAQTLRWYMGILF